MSKTSLEIGVHFGTMIVVGLCADWCHVCRGFRPAFERLAVEWPEARFVWLDVEDDAALVGEVEVEDFPTLAVFDAGRLLHFGSSLPNEAVVGRLLRALMEADRPDVRAPAAVVALAGRLPGCGPE
jgi:thioredoxin 1